MLPKLARAACPFLLCAFPAPAQESVSSHAFSADELIALPVTNWTTKNGFGSLGVRRR